MDRFKMSAAHRAKQFMPFFALTGYDSAINRKGTEADFTQRPELSDESAELINNELLNISEGDLVEIVYYKRGRLLRVVGEVLQLDGIFKRLYVGETLVKIADIVKIIRK